MERITELTLGKNPKWNDEEELEEIFDILMNGIRPK